MQLIVDGIAFEQQSHGGKSRIYSEILPRMCDLDKNLAVTLFTVAGSPRQQLPVHPQINCQTVSIPKFYRSLRPRRIWQPIVHQGRESYRDDLLKNYADGIWHSTYYTLPKQWDGPVVVTMLDMIHERFANLFKGGVNERLREQKKRCLLSANVVISISETTKRDLLQFYEIAPEKIIVVPLGYDKTVFQLKENAGSIPISRGPFLLYVGARDHYKNFVGFLKVYSIWKNQKNLNLVVVGKSWTKGERQLLDQLKLGDAVHLLTEVNDDMLCDLYNHATAFVYPSLYEGFGIPLLEAMACGCPIVASRIPSTVEVAGECPIYFEPNQVESLLTALDVALLEGRVPERVQRGFERSRRYSWDTTARQTLDVYRDVSKS